MPDTSSGYVKVYRSLLEWRWFREPNVLSVYMYLLLTVNHKDQPSGQIIIRAGETITSSVKIAEKTGLSRQQVRTALDKLESTNEITTKSTNQYTHIRVNNWLKYQPNAEEGNQRNNQPINQQSTNEQPTDNQRITTNKNVKNAKNAKKSILASFQPPTVEEVAAYCQERQNKVDPERFVDFYESKGWLIGKNKMKDWKAAVRNWERPEKENAPSRRNQKQLPQYREEVEEETAAMTQQEEAELYELLRQMEGNA